MAFSPVVSLLAQLDFNPYIGLESGVGYSIKYVGMKVYDSHVSIDFSRVSVPLLLKGQYEIANRFNIYLLVGQNSILTLLPLHKYKIVFILHYLHNYQKMPIKYLIWIYLLL